VIRGDLPLAANLASVWLELRDTLGILAETTSPAVPVAKRIRIARKLPVTPVPEEPGEPEAPEAATS
jgi:hypothetical protein